MDRYQTVSAAFDAAHEGHGHRYDVVVRSRYPASTDLRSDLVVAVAELHERRLEAMMNTSETSPTDVAGWLMERLLLKHPRIVGVQVETGDEGGDVTREVR